MTIESERLALNSYTTRSDENGRRILQMAGGDPFALPEKYQKFFEMTEQGVTLAQMARFTTGRRFHIVARYLGFLYNRGLLADPRARELAEAIRPDYAWNESIVLGDIASIELKVFAEAKPLKNPFKSIFANGCAVFGLAALTFLAWRLYRLHSNDIVFDSQTERMLPGLLIGFWFAFIVGRSVRAFIQALSQSKLAGYRARLSLRVDCVSIALSAGDASLAPPTYSYLVASIGGLASLAAPIFFTPILPPSVGAFLPVFICLCLLADLSPFRRSGMTEVLRSLYNYWDRANRRSDTNDNGRSDVDLERRVRRVYFSSATTWIVAFALFLSIPARSLFHVVKDHLHQDGSLGLGCLGILSISLLLILISFIDDVTSPWTGLNSAHVRQIWRRRAKTKIVNPALGLGEMPSRSELARLPVIRQLDPAMRDLLLSRARSLNFGVGEAVCRQSDADRSLFIVLSGRLAVARSFKGGRRKIVAFLEAGAVFGEVAFFLGQPRSADVVAMEDARVLAIPHDPRMSDIKAGASEELRFRIWFLQALVANTTWKEIPADALDALVFAGAKKAFRAGEKVMSEGERADACYFLIQGQASVTQKTKLINRVVAGDAFGEIALLLPGEALRTATVIADTDLLTVKIETERFWHLLGSHLPLGLEFERLADRRLERDQVV